MSESKYRLGNILLQQAPLAHLTGSFVNGRIAQTYLFTGMKSTGRFTTALAFAALLQCSEPVELDNVLDACGKCESCRRIAAGSHPDVHQITPDGYEIRIDQVRALQNAAVLKPTMGNWLVFILDPADRLNTYSANSLLKILEEAPSYVVFILIAGSTSAVLPTILSRSEIVRFQVPSHQAARREVGRAVGLNEQKATLAYSLAEGRFGEALSIAETGLDSLSSPKGLGASHVDYLKSLESFSEDLQQRFAGAGGLDEALGLAALLEHETHLPMQAARKEFCRSLIMAAELPQAFALLYSEALISQLEQSKKMIRKIFDGLISEAKNAYSSAMLKEVDGQINSALSAWVLRQFSELLTCMLNWYADALRWSAGQNETLLLNLNQKEDIITIAEVEEVCLLRSRMTLLEESMYLLRRYVQPSLVIENVLTQIGGPEA